MVMKNQFFRKLILPLFVPLQTIQLSFWNIFDKYNSSSFFKMSVRMILDKLNTIINTTMYTTIIIYFLFKVERVRYLWFSFSFDPVLLLNIRWILYIRVYVCIYIYIPKINNNNTRQYFLSNYDNTFLSLNIYPNNISLQSYLLILENFMTRFKYLRKQNIKDIKKKEKEYIKTKIEDYKDESYLQSKLFKKRRPIKFK